MSEDLPQRQGTRARSILFCASRQAVSEGGVVTRCPADGGGEQVELRVDVRNKARADLTLHANGGVYPFTPYTDPEQEPIRLAIVSSWPGSPQQAGLTLFKASVTQERGALIAVREGAIAFQAHPGVLQGQGRFEIFANEALRGDLVEGVAEIVPYAFSEDELATFSRLEMSTRRPERREGPAVSTRAPAPSASTPDGVAERSIQGGGVEAVPEPAPTQAPPARPTLTSESTPTSGSVAADVRIDCIFYDGLVARTEADEFVQITNYSRSSVDLSGWQLVDGSDGTQVFVFRGFILEADRTIRVYTNEVHREWGGFSFGYDRAVWSNSESDTAVLIDGTGTVVSKRSYPPGCEAAGS